LVQFKNRASEKKKADLGEQSAKGESNGSWRWQGCKCVKSEIVCTLCGWGIHCTSGKFWAVHTLPENSG
jgi:hypothetical protein